MARLDTLKRTGKHSRQRVGRGSKRGKTSGRGTKGQNARAGNKKRPELRDIIKKLPKRRGYGKNRGRTVVPRPPAVLITLEQINRMFDAGAEVSLATLREHKLLSVKGARTPRVKIVATGVLSKKVTVRGPVVTAGARSAIEKLGGSIAV